MQSNIILYTRPSSWIEGESIRQLERAAALPGIVRVAGFPDLHPGKGGPVGVAMLSEGMFYPYLIGSDVGCGMALFATELVSAKAKLEKWSKKLCGLERPWEGDTTEWLQKCGAEALGSSSALGSIGMASIDECSKYFGGFTSSLGTIGGGNHFAELLKVQDIIDGVTFRYHGLDGDCLFLLVHSGSRGLGELLCQNHVAHYRDAGLCVEDDAVSEGRYPGATYLHRHDYCVHWATANRELIAHRFLGQLGSDYFRILDSPHNSITCIEHLGKSYFLHRKGAAPTDSSRDKMYFAQNQFLNKPRIAVSGKREGDNGVWPGRLYEVENEELIIIPGSRGSLSYLVKPIGDQSANLWSIAHGAGRKWSRSECEGRLRERYSADSLRKTRLGSYVVCDDKALLYEEAPQAYKDIDAVVADLVSFGLVRVVATFTPVLTYKAKGR